MAQIISLEKIKSIISDPAKKQKFLIVAIIFIFLMVSWYIYSNYFKLTITKLPGLIQPSEEEIERISLNLDILKNEKYQNLQLFFTTAKLSDKRNSRPFTQSK